MKKTFFRNQKHDADYIKFVKDAGAARRQQADREKEGPQILEVLKKNRGFPVTGKGFQFVPDGGDSLTGFRRVDMRL